ncbi:hmg box protein [Paraphaeosphaeria minitans]|uniref:Hmg box protein n=1 Tax=Paraphaeosphaeria minitans TaxID=565426 RepID=A0A9P6G446_9PLEO|nr:hmg box protein [Paraphaeosphaeria minitans]
MSIPSPSLPMLPDVLKRLGLTSYLHALSENGFHNWETVLDITEEDLTALNFKLGHRRALQREIATFRGLPSTLALDESNASDQPALSTSALETLTRQTLTPPPREKRRYRRHPRPDSHAPKKPKTAYVNFADHLRTEPDISILSFVDIAREVGRRWQHLPPEQKRIWESYAARAMQEYEAQMDEYKRTESWRKHQAYLIGFRSQHQTPSKGSSSSTRPSQSRTTTSSSCTPHHDYSRASPSASSESPPTSLTSPATSLGMEAEVCHNALTLAFSELVSLRGEILGQGVWPYDARHLPSEQLVRKAMYAFVQGTGSLLYMWTYAQVDEILDRIYRPQQPVDAMTLAECFTVAAMGAHYDMDCFPDRIRRVLYASGTLCFNEKTARLDYLRTMRLLLATAFYALLEEHMSARYVLVAALQIARWKYPALAKETSDAAADANWRRLFRSLIFMDCWLSYTLGYASEVTSQDVALACPASSVGLTLDEQIHVQTSRIGLVAADISKALSSPEMVTRDTIQTLADQLERWRSEVPQMLSIGSLTSPNPPPMTLYQRRAILMVHIMYFGTVMLLYRQLLVATAEMQLTDGAAWDLNLSIEDAKRYRNECALAGQQVARILRLISFDGTLAKRCWLIIYWAFTACIVLLYSATAKFLEGQADTVENDLAYSKACMDMLESCRATEPIAARYLDILWPLCDTLRDIHHRMMGRAKTSIYALLQGDSNTLSPPIPVSKAEMGPISEKLSALLTDRFGRKQTLGDNSMRRVLNSDGSCSVFWWR